MPLIAYSPADVEVTFLLTRRNLLRRNSLRAIDPAIGAEGRSVGRWIVDLALPIIMGWAVFAGLAIIVSEPLVQHSHIHGCAWLLGEPDRCPTDFGDPIGLGDIFFPDPVSAPQWSPETLH